MRKLLLAVLLLAALPHAQSAFITGQWSWGDSVTWGAVSPSSSLYRLGNVLLRDSAGTFGTITSDSCSNPIVELYLGHNAIWKRGELSYEVRTNGQTDSTQSKLYFDSRYCTNAPASTGCDPWVSHGRFTGDAMTVVTDSLITQATAAGVTWAPTRVIFNVPGGNQIRVCNENYIAGAAAGDTVDYRRQVMRFQ